MAMPFLGILFLLSQRHRPAENYQDDTQSAEKPDGPIQLTGLDQLAGGHHGGLGAAGVLLGDELPVHFALAVGDGVVRLDVQGQCDGQGGALALAEGAQQAARSAEGANGVGLAAEDLLGALGHGHGEVGQERVHGVRVGDVGIHGGIGLAVGNSHNVELNIIRIGCGALIADGDGLGQRVAGHNALEAAEQVRAGVTSRLGGNEQPILAPVDNIRGGGGLGEGGNGQAHDQDQRQDQREYGFAGFFHIPTPLSSGIGSDAALGNAYAPSLANRLGGFALDGLGHNVHSLIAAVRVGINTLQLNATDQVAFRLFVRRDGLRIVVIVTIFYPSITGDKLWNFRNAADVLPFGIGPVGHQLDADERVSIANVRHVDIGFYARILIENLAYRTRDLGGRECIGNIACLAGQPGDGAADGQGQQKNGGQGHGCQTAGGPLGRPFSGMPGGRFALAFKSACIH